MKLGKQMRFEAIAPTAELIAEMLRSQTKLKENCAVRRTKLTFLAKIAEEGRIVFEQFRRTVTRTRETFHRLRRPNRAINLVRDRFSLFKHLLVNLCAPVFRT